MCRLFVSDKFKGKSGKGLFGDVMMEVDWSVGQIMDTLKKNGLEDNTWVIFTSDNGPWLSYGDHAGSAGPLREGKGTCWEGGTRVAGIMKWPAKIPAGTTTDTMMMTIDILPTIAHVIDAKLPDHKIDGLNCWPIVAGESGAKNPHDFYAFYYEQNQLQAITSGDGRWKLQLPHKLPQPPADIPKGHRRHPRALQTAEDRAAGTLRPLHRHQRIQERRRQHPDEVAKLQKHAEAIRAESGTAS
jgi:arylsulfatase A